MDTNFEYKNNMRGFTLVELLAVIVVLAIVMLIGVNAILPQMDKSRRNAFAIEANGVIKSAQQYVTTAALTNGLVINTDGICIDIDTLINNGQSDLEKDKYKGSVWVRKPSATSDIYIYTVWMYGKYQLDFTEDEAKKQTENKSIVLSDIKDAGTGGDGFKNCRGLGTKVTS